ncbi:MAG TPA: hypothetical protein VK815_13240 [Candidatus Acidoferrales bacterium]|jgi:hypothetical protein|nr:hypothetical protein [Candidatus Acidoferrales bacterium]
MGIKDQSLRTATVPETAEIQPNQGKSNHFYFMRHELDQAPLRSNASAAENMNLRNKAKLKMQKPTYFTDVKWRFSR